MTALTTNSPSVRKMDCAAFQISDVEWDAKKGRFPLQAQELVPGPSVWVEGVT